MLPPDKQTVLFLCTGNYYRSRYSEVFFNALADQAGLPWTALSRGLALERGIYNIGPMARVAVTALAKRGMTADRACSRFPIQVRPYDFEQAQRIIALKQAEHLPILRERFPAFVDRVEFWHIDDEPYVLPLIEKEVRLLIDSLQSTA